MTFHVFTSITSNYIPKARVLAQSVKKYHPEAKFHLVLCDILPSSFELSNEPFDFVITVDKLPITEWKSWVFKHSIVEMCTGVKPIALKEIIRIHNCEKVIYFDPDMVILNKLDSILKKLDQYSILLTPHQTTPEKTNEAVIDNEICSLKHGVFNLGFIAIKNSEESQSFLDWWSNRCLNFCYNDIPGGLFTDQKWIDLAPGFFDDLGILREPVYNVATWNLTNRQASGSLEKGILINEQPLIFYHFSGFDSGAQEVMLKKYGNYSKVLFELRNWYIQECEKNGQAKIGNTPCNYSFFENKIEINNRQRLLYRQRIDLQNAFPNPFFVTDNINTSKAYFHWYNAHGEQEFVEKLSNYSEPSQALSQLQSEVEFLRDKIRGMESSKFWNLRNKWFSLKEKLSKK